MEGHKLSGKRPPVDRRLDEAGKSIETSRIGVEGGVEGRFLSAETALLAAKVEETVGLVTLGEGHRAVLVGVGDLYLELTSVVRGRRVAAGALFLSDGIRRLRGLVESFTTSIQAKETKLH